MHIADYNPLERNWYKEAVALKGETLITNPYMDEETGDMVVTIARQVKDQSGVLALDIKLEEFQKSQIQSESGKTAILLFWVTIIWSFHILH